MLKNYSKKLFVIYLYPVNCVHCNDVRNVYYIDILHIASKDFDSGVVSKNICVEIDMIRNALMDSFLNVVCYDFGLSYHTQNVV